MILDKGDYVTNNCINNKCSRCGDCCGAGPMPITRHEEKVIRKYIKENNIKPMPQEVRQHKDKAEIQLHCCFYDYMNHTCTIYKVRPDVCRSFKCNMTPEEVHNNKARTHARGFWNHITPDKNSKIHLTNFKLLFYDSPLDLFRWFVANLEKEMSREQAVEATCKFIAQNYDGNTKALFDKINEELKTDEPFIFTNKDVTIISNDTSNNSI